MHTCTYTRNLCYQNKLSNISDGKLILFKIHPFFFQSYKNVLSCIRKWRSDLLRRTDLPTLNSRHARQVVVIERQIRDGIGNHLTMLHKVICHHHKKNGNKTTYLNIPSSKIILIFEPFKKKKSILKKFSIIIITYSFGAQEMP